MILYIAGPYRAKDEKGVAANIAKSRQVSIAVWEAGHFALSPCLNTAHFERDCGCEDTDYLSRDLDMLSRCDGIVMVPGWEKSKGATAELEYAKERGMPFWFAPDIPPLHPTEVRCPEQTRGFIDTVMGMYRLHLSKNQDYSPANILGTGEVGLVTRLWDKIARLMNLEGFSFDVGQSAFTAPKEPRHESIEDTLSDAAVYAVIGLLLRKGAWGR